MQTNIIKEGRTFKFKLLKVIKSTSCFTMNAVLLEHNHKLYIMPVLRDKVDLIIKDQPPVYAREVEAIAEGENYRRTLICRVYKDSTSKLYEYAPGNDVQNRMDEELMKLSGYPYNMKWNCVYDFDSFEITCAPLVQHGLATHNKLY
jgi:hypothetical protein